ncbi:Co2+/Mg2+ efflux protein ApaG [Deinococcus metallilatus]|uniref:ApaG protein n=1 Tax=Deinococcus metallilatus TaxID=1211322 RepID=A0AAJ5F0X5_9DEIO|nr:Co2+/Mg2+ efflux protein ApaG [Deinococcus metallilatus]MBB5296263.1 ApaG protein [Deinococcus metallilatus]QBY09693.1 Co2+/Mg2+ efflux protein ApaG [Deinococcus metallilatus]RXJ08891.1 Co2+/Mg2+ efflux protein ApaG [Deinococcus metallilatus]TLK23730.1 Co2+/Mg2+ efflux protein ApaG [Deinococcus metallilatus]GMA14129.1 protein ApaG [Deinococcus metallilatus]
MSHPSYSTGPDVRVSVDVSYLPAHSTPGRRVFSYVIQVENHSDQTWQLLARHWDILDAGGRETVVDGEGVVGEQPVIPPGGAFVYDSFVTVQDTPGRMQGYYVMQDAWGVRAQVPIPPFVLEVPGERTLN